MTILLSNNLALLNNRGRIWSDERCFAGAYVPRRIATDTSLLRAISLLDFLSESSFSEERDKNKTGYTSAATYPRSSPKPYNSAYHASQRNTITVSLYSKPNEAHREPDACWWLASLLCRRFCKNKKMCVACRDGTFTFLHLVRTKTKVQETNTSQDWRCERSRFSVLEADNRVLDGPRTSKFYRCRLFDGT